ncbi:RNA polymerase II transcription factor B 52 kDa subunit [Podospora pseudopauciseta]|uniref:RNA polymerase II transcription factor B subunit 2 n=2 Tax=Podospora TaxID=5144 RepID=A0ABR0HCB6_9PEZI|nr:RNA polymerase II transcription factor B 52 kDa subunit [Podospora pseudopauciseta]KAK4676811.1 RNA polymerase II transcription factor B 52 kDa subunit [Podospora pseudoanserina]
MSSFGPSSFLLDDYLEKLPGATFRKLYQQPSTAFAIFRRMLPPLAKVYVQALLYSPTPLTTNDIELWTQPEGKGTSNRAIARLRSLHIAQLSQSTRAKKAQDIQLTANFKKSLRLALEGGGSHNSFGVPSTLPTDPKIHIQYLDHWAGRIWQDILYYVVNSVPMKANESGGRHGSGGGGPKRAVRELLKMGGLVREGAGGLVQISEHGFNFLLQEANAQVWTLLLLWLEAADRNKALAKEQGTDITGTAIDNVEMLSFLFMLASLELGRAYDTSALTETRKNMLPALADFGLIYIDRDRPQQYYPTRLATTLTSLSTMRSVSASIDAATKKTPGDAGSLGADSTPTAPADENGGIVVETNYRIYAYTSSPLQIAILKLFCRLHMRFPNMVTARLTRESVQEAIKEGITANQIIDYLVAHAHPQMRRAAAAKGTTVIPPTVMDQIRLWQLESQRMQKTPGFQFKDFESVEEYRQLAEYATEIGVLVWKDDRKGTFFVSKVEQIREFLKARKKGN